MLAGNRRFTVLLALLSLIAAVFGFSGVLDQFGWGW